MPVEAVMFWNEPNNKSHWDLEIDPEWEMYAAMVKCASKAVAEANPALTRVLGGISPIDTAFIQRLANKGVLETLRALEFFPNYTPQIGICQWFHFEDHRLDEAVCWLRQLGVRHLRTGLSWADSFQPDAEAWFDRQMEALAEFDVTLTFCFTPEHRG